MKLPFFASFIVFIFILQHNIRKGKKASEQMENEFWNRELSANDVRRQSLDDLQYISFAAEPFYPLNMLDAKICPDFLSKNPEIKEIIVIVNRQAVTLKGKSSYVYVDVFEYINFDVSAAASRGRGIVTLLNGRPAQFMEPLTEGDHIDIYWK